MNPLSSRPSDQAAASPAWDENAACDRCGAFGAYAWEGTVLCLRCYTERGSCCAEFEKQDEPPPDATE